MVKELCHLGAHLGRGCPSCLQALEAVDPAEQELVLGLLWADGGGWDSAAPTLDAARLERAVQEGLARQERVEVAGEEPKQGDAATPQASNVVPLHAGRAGGGQGPDRSWWTTRAALAAAGLAAAAAILVAVLPGRWGGEAPGGGALPGPGEDPALAARGAAGELGPSFELSVVGSSGELVPLLAGDKVRPATQVTWGWANPGGRYGTLRVSLCQGARQQQCTPLSEPRPISAVGPDEDSPRVAPVPLDTPPGPVRICGSFSPTGSEAAPVELCTQFSLVQP